MRNRLLTLLSMAFVAMTSFAQLAWTEPEAMDPDTEPSALASEHVYKVRNVESQKYLGGGQAWFTWGTTAVLKELEEDAISFTLTQEEKGWTLKNYGGTWNNCYLFVSGNNKEGYAMHVDNASNEHRYFEIIDQGDNQYRLRVAEDDSDFGKAKTDDWEYKFVCWDKTDDVAENGALLAALVPDNENTFAEFEFIDQNVHLYLAKTELYNLAKTIVDEKLDVDYETYTAVYEGTDYAAIKAAIKALTETVNTALKEKILAVGEDGVNPPSEDNPCDATALITNAKFDDQMKGWTNSFVKGVSGDNIMWQSRTDTNADSGVSLSGFIEAWSGHDYGKIGHNSLGDGEISQVITYMPQGKYKFTCDATACYQDDWQKTTGIQLFAKGGTLDVFEEIKTGNGLPEHFEMTFVNTAVGDITIGLRAVSTTANWIAADNFTLTYYGKVEGDPEKIIFDAVVKEIEEKYGDVTALKANKDTIAAYSTALANAKAAVEDFDTYKKALQDAAKALQTSINEYAAFIADVEYFLEKVEGAAAEWPGMSSAVADLYQNARDSYYNGTATSESMANFVNESSKAIADYISANVEPGKDVTILLNNPGFDKDRSGWEITNYDGTGDVSAGNHRWGGENIILPVGFVKEGGVEVTEQETLVSGCNEIWKGAFKYQQTIYNMPAGLYTLSCKGFMRNEDNQSDVSKPENSPELFAIIGEDTQTQKFANIFGDCSEAMLYNGKEEGDEGVAYGGGIGQEQDKNEASAANGMYYPNGMCGASAHFAAGYYKQEFDIVVTETSNIIVGARSKATNYWTLFDDFQIVYKGKNANLLTATIDKLIEDINAAQENENDIVLTKDVKAEANAAIAAGEAAKAGNDFDESSDAVAGLRQALADVQDNLKFVTEFYNEYYEMEQYRFEGLDGAYYGSALSFNGVPAIIDEIADKFTTEDEAFADSADVENYRIELKKAYTQAVMEAASVETANEDGPADVTAAIYNPNSMSYDYDEDTGELYAIGAKGWTVSKGKVGSGNSGNKATEFFQQAFDINQTIYSLTPGYYRVKVNGFYRDGNGARIDSCYNKVEGFEEHAYATLYAGEAETALRLITEEESMTRWNEYINDDLYEGISAGNSFEIKTPDETDDNPYIPQNAAGAYAAFNLYYEWGEADMWQNILQFKVEEGQESVTIGIRKTDDQNVKADAEQGIEAKEYGDWTIWANWRLEYVGTTEPSTDPTTAIKGVDYVAAPAKAAIYNIAGQRVNKAVKGLYIINGKKYVVK